MGKNSKARRDAKARRQAPRRRPGGTSSGPPSGQSHGHPFGQPRPVDPVDPVGPVDPVDPVASAERLWREVALAAPTTPGGRSPGDALTRLARMDQDAVARGAAHALVDVVGLMWTAGWQPAELTRHARLRASASAARLVEVAVHADHARRSRQRIDPRWSAQVADLPQARVSLQGAWVSAWAQREAIGREVTLLEVAAALHLLWRLPTLEVVLPPPGSTVPTVGPPREATADQPVLHRIRKLLDKAESTSFEAEAAALTAKAQELMTRHAIDQALLDAPAPGDVPVVVRVPIDAPYADAKSLLLQVVAAASRCRAVFMGRLAMSSLIGHVADVAGVELVYTSLLVQAQRALAEAARTAAPGTRTRSQSYRSAFLVSFTTRVGERLRAAGDDVVAAASAAESGRFLPVLAAREEAVEARVDSLFGALTTRSPVRGGYDAQGHLDGRAAGDRAKLTAGELRG